MLRSGFGRHLQFLDRQDVLFLKRISQYLILMATIALWAVKISVSLFILQLIKGTHRIATRIIYGLITVTTIASIGQGIFWGLQAQPLRKLWTPEIPGTVKDIRTLVRSIIIFTCKRGTACYRDIGTGPTVTNTLTHHQVSTAPQTYSTVYHQYTSLAI
jgi:hypothetical protein